MAERWNLTSQGVQFSAWKTAVATDELTFLHVSYLAADSTSYPQDGIDLALPRRDNALYPGLEAVFISYEKRATVRFTCPSVRAFRVLDEAGLTELWIASKDRPRPTQTTFKVRGHGWQAESELEWFMGAGPDYFSYMVATGNQCLEIVCSDEPQVDIRPAVVRPLE